MKTFFIRLAWAICAWLCFHGLVFFAGVLFESVPFAFHLGRLIAR